MTGIPALCPGAAVAVSAAVVAYTTLNPADKSANVTLSNGDLTAKTNGTIGSVRAVTGKSSGKYYIEALVDLLSTPQQWGIGFCNSATSLAVVIGKDTGQANNFSYLGNGNVVKQNVNQSTSHTDPVTGDLIGMAIDIDAGKAWFRLNGTWQKGGDPAAGTGNVVSFTAGTTMFPAIGARDNNDGATYNFGASAFSGSVPTGFTSGWPT